MNNGLTWGIGQELVVEKYGSQPQWANTDINYCTVPWFESIKFLFNFSCISTKCKIKRVSLCTLCESRHDLNVELETYSHSISLPSFSWLPIAVFPGIHWVTHILVTCHPAWTIVIYPTGAALKRPPRNLNCAECSYMCAYGLALFFVTLHCCYKSRTRFKMLGGTMKPYMNWNLK